MRGRLDDPRFRGRSLASLLLDQRFVAGSRQLPAQRHPVRRGTARERAAADLDDDARRGSRARSSTSSRAKLSHATASPTTRTARARRSATACAFEDYRFLAYGREGAPCWVVRHAHRAPRRGRPRPLPLRALPARDAQARAMSDGEALGLYPAASFRIATGATAGERRLRQARWYFQRRDDRGAASRRAGRVVRARRPRRSTTCARGRRRARARRADRLSAARVDRRAARSCTARGMSRGRRARDRRRRAASLVAEDPAQPLVLRRDVGRVARASATADRARHARRRRRSRCAPLWPDDFALGRAAAAARDAGRDSRARAARADARGAARRRAKPVRGVDAVAARRGARDWTGRPVLALMVNGAQGDDDEAHARPLRDRHRARARRRPHRRLAGQQLLLARQSRARKASSPRPCRSTTTSAISTAARAGTGRATCSSLVLRDERAAALVQSALEPRLQPVLPAPARVLPPGRQLHEHQRRHAARARLADSARAARRTALARVARLPVLIALKERSLAKAKIAFDYLCTDQTRLMPAAALEEAYASLRALVARRRRTARARSARMLARTSTRSRSCAFRSFRRAARSATRRWCRRCGIQARVPGRSRARADRAGAAAAVSRNAARPRPPRAAAARPPTTPRSRVGRARRSSGILVLAWRAWRRADSVTRPRVEQAVAPRERRKPLHPQRGHHQRADAADDRRRRPAP